MKYPKGSHRYEPPVLVPVADFDEHGASEYLHIPVRTLQTMRYRGKGPAYYKIGDGPKARVRYRREDCAAWDRARTRRIEPASELKKPVLMPVAVEVKI
jgi:hypothetical protein